MQCVLYREVIVDGGRHVPAMLQLLAAAQWRHVDDMFHVVCSTS